MLTPETRHRDFPSLEGMAYLNTAAEGIPPRQAADALAEYLSDKQLGMDGRERHEARRGIARELAGRVLGLTADEVGLCSCSSEAFNLAALALRLRDGDEVIISDLEFPAGATPWLHQDCPADAKLWRHREGSLRLEDLVPLLSNNTRLVVVSLVSFYNGYTIALPPLVETVRKHSPAMIAVDVTQAAGRIPLELEGVDLVIGSTYKWLLGPHGGGIVGVPARRAREWTVPLGGSFNLANAFDADRFERVVTKPGAASFTVGMPSYAVVYALAAGLQYISDVGVDAIHTHAQPIVHACISGLKKLPVESLTPDRPESLAGIVAFRHPAADRLARFLHDRGVHIMHHAGRLRVSIHGYNTQADVERFLRTLKEALTHA